MQVQPAVVTNPADCGALVGGPRPRVQPQTSHIAILPYCHMIASRIRLLIHKYEAADVDVDAHVRTSTNPMGLDSRCRIHGSGLLYHTG